MAGVPLRSPAVRRHLPRLTHCRTPCDIRRDQGVHRLQARRLRRTRLALADAESRSKIEAKLSELKQ
jgi:hypothetical protein